MRWVESLLADGNDIVVTVSRVMHEDEAGDWLALLAIDAVPEEEKMMFTYSSLVPLVDKCSVTSTVKWK